MKRLPALYNQILLVAIKELSFDLELTPEEVAERAHAIAQAAIRMRDEL